jgi:DNA-binding response OmpR family regulator
MRGSRPSPMGTNALFAPGLANSPDAGGTTGEHVHLLAVRGGGAALHALLRGCGFDVEVIAQLPVGGTGAMGGTGGTGGTESGVLRIGALVVDTRGHEIRLGPRTVQCTLTEFRLLERLAAHAGQVLSRRQLLAHVHGSADYLVERTIDSHVRNLRRKLGRPRISGTPQITTVFGVGYKLVEPTGPAAVRLVR